MKFTFEQLWKIGALIVTLTLAFAEVKSQRAEIAQLKKDACFTYNRVMRIEYGEGAVEPCE